MLTRATRWFLIAAPAIGGAMLLIFGTAGPTSQAFGWTLIGIAVTVWMSNFFIRMTFDEDKFEREAADREKRAVAQQNRLEHRETAEPVEPADLSRHPRGAQGSDRSGELDPPRRPERPPSRHPPARRLARRPRRPM
jgi:hypothetical protein